MAEVLWPEYVLDILLELPDGERENVIEKAGQLERFPRMYPVRMKGLLMFMVLPLLNLVVFAWFNRVALVRILALRQQLAV